jgi:hypothetical protein
MRMIQVLIIAAELLMIITPSHPLHTQRHAIQVAGSASGMALVGLSKSRRDTASASLRPVPVITAQTPDCTSIKPAAIHACR